MVVISRLRSNRKVCQRREGGLVHGRERERSLVWVLLGLAWVKVFGTSRMTRWILRSVLDLVDHQVSWEASGMALWETAQVEAAWIVV